MQFFEVQPNAVPNPKTTCLLQKKIDSSACILNVGTFINIPGYVIHGNGGVNTGIAFNLVLAMRIINIF